MLDSKLADANSVGKYFYRLEQKHQAVCDQQQQLNGSLLLTLSEKNKELSKQFGMLH